MITTLVALTLSSAAPAVAATAKDQDGQVCRQFRVTGSLIRTYKLCKTKAEWARYEEDVRRAAREMQDSRLTPNR